MSQENQVTLYHSTDRKGLEGVIITRRLFGMERIKNHHGYSGGSNLTPHQEASLTFIKAYKGYGRWRDVDGPPELFILTFILPEALITWVGRTHPIGCDEYATTLTVDVDVLPEQYLQNLHAGMHRMTREKARELQERGEIRFYELPLDFLTCVDPVEFTYTGVKYPQLNSNKRWLSA